MVERRKALRVFGLMLVGFGEFFLWARHRFGALHLLDVLQLMLAGICCGLCLPTLLRGIQVGAMTRRSRTAPLLVVGLINVYLAGRSPRIEPGDMVQLIPAGLMIGMGLLGVAILTGKVRARPSEEPNAVPSILRG